MPRMLLEIGMRLPVELVGEQPLDLVAAVVAGRQADGMQHDQVDARACRARPEVGRGQALRNAYQPSCQRSARAASALIAAAASSVAVGRADAQARDAVADLPQAQAEPRGGGGAVEAALAQGAHQDLALLLVEVGLQVGGHGRRRRHRADRGGARRRGGGERRASAGDRRRRARARAVRCLLGLEVQMQFVAVVERHRAVQQVLELAHIAAAADAAARLSITDGDSTGTVACRRRARCAPAARRTARAGPRAGRAAPARRSRSR